MTITRSTLSAFIEALAAVVPLHGPADKALGRYFREHRDLGAAERAALAERVYATLRHLGQLRHVVPRDTPRALALALLVMKEGVSVRELDGIVKADELTWLAGLKAIDRDSWPTHVRLGLPEWIYTKLAQQMPEAALATLAQALNEPASLSLRVNTIKASREAARTELAAVGIAATPTAYSPFGLRVEGKPHLSALRPFSDGWVEVQDEGSQLLALLVEPKRGELVIDFCAGAGGKTLALGQLMDSKGRLYAFDTSDKRLANLAPRLKRSGLSNVHPQRIANENDLRVKRLAGKADRVLVDAPCTGLGTLRRNPDLKWRQSPESLAEMVVKQAAILAAAARMVRPGGRLVYATCSLLEEENDRQIAAFLQASPEFTVVDVRDILARHRIDLPQIGPHLRLDPAQHGTDGFFAAVLERSA